MKRGLSVKTIVSIVAIFLAISCIVAVASPAQLSEEYDLVILNGTVVDGTGALGFQADVGIKDGKIAKISNLTTAEAKKTIDAAGLVVAPGFIDNHTNTASQLLVNPRAESKIRQGVTTEFKGEQGVGPRAYSPDRDYVGHAGFYNLLMEKGIAVNYGSLVDQSDVRKVVLGSEDRVPTAEELEVMKALVAQT